MAATWKVISQSPQTYVDGGGQVQEGYSIVFQTGEGHTGTVKVSQQQYTPDKVRALIQPVADQLDSIGALTSAAE